LFDEIEKIKKSILKEFLLFWFNLSHFNLVNLGIFSEKRILLIFYEKKMPLFFWKFIEEKIFPKNEENFRVIRLKVLAFNK